MKKILDKLLNMILGVGLDILILKLIYDIAVIVQEILKNR